MRKLLFVGAALAALSAPATAQERSHLVYFALDRATLDAEARAVVDAAAAEYLATGSTSVSIVGHTDRSGSDAYNMALSERRARAVSDELVRRGVPEGAVVLAWRGEAEPAVPTADGVVERLNRRAEISIAEAETAPPPPPAPAAEGPKRWRVGVGPYIGVNLEDDDESVFIGPNLTAAYQATPRLSLFLNQAVFQNTGADDDGAGGRSGGGFDYNFGDFGGFTPFVGGNLGYLYIDGSGTGGFFGGPQTGVRAGPFELKASYDFVEDRDADEGVISILLGYNIFF